MKINKPLLYVLLSTLLVTSVVVTVVIIEDNNTQISNNSSNPISEHISHEVSNSDSTLITPISVPPDNRELSDVLYQRNIVTNTFDYSELELSRNEDANLHSSSIRYEDYLLLKTLNPKKENLKTTSGSLIYVNEDGIASSRKTPKAMSFKKDYYYQVIINYESNLKNGPFTNYFALQYDLTPNTSFSNDGHLTCLGQLVFQNKMGIVYRCDEDINNVGLRFYISSLESEITYYSLQLITLGTSYDDNMLPLINAFDKDTSSSRTNVALYNCNYASCDFLGNINSDSFDISFRPKYLGYLSFVPLDDSMSVNFYDTYITYHPTKETLLKDINNMNSIFHAYNNTLSDYYTANSLYRLEKAVELGVKTIEMDIRFTSDNVPVMSHDDLGKATNLYVYDDINQYYLKDQEITIPIEDLTYEELLNYDFGKYFGNENQRILKFEDLLDNISKTNVNLDLEFKAVQEEENSRMVIQLLEQYNMKSRTYISSFQRLVISQFGSLDSSLNLKRIAGVGTSLNHYIHFSKDYKNDSNIVIVDMAKAMINPVSIASLTSLGINPQSYLFDIDNEILSSFCNGIKGLTSNYVNVATSLRNQLID